MSKTIRIAIAEDHPILLESMRTFLNSIPHFQVVIAVTNGKELLRKMTTKQVDIVLLDLEMPILDGRKTLQILHKRIKKSPGIIILSMHGGTAFVRKYMLSGANAYLDKGCDLSELLDAIRGVHFIGYYFSPHIPEDLRLEILFDRSSDPRTIEEDMLTEREIEVLRLLCEGMPSKDVATALNLSSRTIENHRRRIYYKLGATNTLSMLREAVRKGYFELNL
ncbi:MAG: hypothetical protein A3D92_10395 [Bacteroidetes bacterium RIFCSPHIGHO2_02_FULL_44_7]|nr:MAG: hypothetical protein A3D92_10395 [Bacteroidetes bacterium RIFCSPHIGHO2_02_FULL_44_7]